MSAFSYQHLPFIVDHSVLFPLPSSPLLSDMTTPSRFSVEACMEEFNSGGLGPFHDWDVQNVSNGDGSCGIDGGGMNEIMVEKGFSVATEKQSTDRSSAANDYNSDQAGKQEDGGSICHRRRKRKGNKGGGSASNCDKFKNCKDGEARKGAKRQKKYRHQKELVEEEEEDRGSPDHQGEAPTPSPTDYIRVRARRGQATDRHSLAERVRREKMSERMKVLQALVPGCDKVIGKAPMLDEIINYVQSLQYQVEFLSVKLASVEPTLYNIDAGAMEGGQRLISCSLQPSILTLMQQLSAAPTTSSTTNTTAGTSPPTLFADSSSFVHIPDSSYLDELDAAPLLISSSLANLLQYHQGDRDQPIDLWPIYAGQYDHSSCSSNGPGSSFWFWEEDLGSGGDQRDSLMSCASASLMDS